MKVFVYDGDCSLCSKFINFLVNINENVDLLITDFNSKWFQINMNDSLNKTTVIYVTTESYYASDAIINVIADANSKFIFLKLLYVIPRSIRNYIYSFISKRRYKFNQKTPTVCKIPSKKFYSMYLE